MHTVDSKKRNLTTAFTGYLIKFKNSSFHKEDIINATQREET